MPLSGVNLCSLINIAPLVQLIQRRPHATSPHQCNLNVTAASVAQHLDPLSHRRFSNNAALTVQHGTTHEVQPNATLSHQCIPNNGTSTVQHGAAQELQSDAAQRAKPVQPPLSHRRFSNNVATIVQHGATNEVQHNATSSHQSIPNNAAPTVQQSAAQKVQPDVAQRAKLA